LKANKAKRASSTSVTVSMEDYMKLQDTLKVNDEEISSLQKEKLVLEETIQDVLKSNSEDKQSKKDGKTYSVDTRMMVYTSIVNQVPTKNIPILIKDLAERSGDKMTSIPHRSTVEQMTRELGVISTLQTAELCAKTEDLTIGFDATTQEGVHINSIHVTTKTDCKVIAVDQLAGGTTDDYHSHVCDSVDEMASVHSDFHNEEYQNSRKNIIDNISNTMTDRVAVNHSSIMKINETWGKTLNELNCIYIRLIQLPVLADPH
jgi:hypothetical protein